MVITWWNHTRKLGNEVIPNKYMTEILKKRDKDNSKNEGKIVLIRKTRENNICDGKTT